jgi:hypothetical protein
VNASAPRRVASPYARRLAGERGLQVADLAGSGPGGRIVAADVLAACPANTPTAPVTSSPNTVAAASPVSNLPCIVGATARLSELNDLLAAFATAGRDVAREDVIVRAAAHALVPTSVGVTSTTNEAISVETDTGGIVLADVRNLTVSALRALRKDGGSKLNSSPSSSSSAGLSVRLNSRAGVRSLLMPLIPGIPMRLAVSFSEDGTSADCMLAHDPDVVSANRAEAILASLRDGLQEPLMLFV